MTLIILALSFTTTLLAETKGLKTTLLERMVQPKVSLDSAYISEAHVNNSQGSVRVEKNQIRLNNAIGGISYTNWSFLWNNIAALPFGNGVDKPIEQTHSININANIPWFINEKWFALASISARSTFEEEMDDSYGVSAFGFAAYKLSDNHTFTMGAFANYHPVSTLVLPVISYSYRARQKDGVQVVVGFPRAYIGYFVNDKILLRGGMIFSQSVIKLSDKSVIENSGYIEAEDYMSNLGVSYELTSHFTLKGDLLYSLKRNFIIYNSAGEEAQQYNIDPSLGVGLRLEYLF